MGEDRPFEILDARFTVGHRREHVGLALDTALNHGRIGNAKRRQRPYRLMIDAGQFVSRTTDHTDDVERRIIEYVAMFGGDHEGDTLRSAESLRERVVQFNVAVCPREEVDKAG